MSLKAIEYTNYLRPKKFKYAWLKIIWNNIKQLLD